MTMLAVADELASAAEIIMGKLDRIPAAIVRGLRVDASDGGSKLLLRDPLLARLRYELPFVLANYAMCRWRDAFRILNSASFAQKLRHASLSLVVRLRQPNCLQSNALAQTLDACVNSPYVECA